MVNIGGIEVDSNIVIYAVSGAVGALIRTLNWKIENPAESVNPYLVARNIVIGGVAGIVADTSYINAMSAGLAGEFVLQNLGQKAQPTVMKTVDSVKSLVSK